MDRGYWRRARQETRKATGWRNWGADGTFTIPQVAPGEHDLVVAFTPGGEDDAYIHAIRIGDPDAPVEAVHVGEEQLPPLDIVVKPNGGAAEMHSERRQR
jgi:hypothetical protein